MIKNRHLFIAVLALIIAVASSGVIASFTDQIRRTLINESASFLGADTVLDSSKPIPERWLKRADEASLQAARVVEFSSMVFSETNLLLGSIKAVDPSYPLKGELVIKPLDGSGANQALSDIEALSTQDTPQSNEIWISESLYFRLGLDTLPAERGYKKPIALTIGNAQFKLSHILVKEPDSAQSLFGASPRAMISLSALSSLEVLGPGSRASYKLQLAGDEKSLNAFTTKIEDELGEHTSIQSVQDRDRNLGDALNRGLSFFSIASVLSIILCAIAIALSSHLYAQSKVQTIALRKSFGESATSVLLMEIKTLGVAAAIGLVLGLAVAIGLNTILINLIAPLFSVEISSFSAFSLIYPTLACLTIFYLFSLPSAISLASISPWQVLKAKAFKPRMALLVIISLLVLFGLFCFYLKNLYWALLLSAVIAGLMLIIAAVLRTVLHGLLRGLSRWFASGYFIIALRNLYRQINLNAFTVSVLSLLFFSVCTLVLLRTELIDSWREQLNEDTPNYFAFNIYGDNLDAINSFVKKHQLPSAPSYPMVRGRVTKIANEDFSQRLTRLSAREGHDRELNLTWSATLGADNKVVEGLWWNKLYSQCDSISARCPLLVSVEQDYARDFAIDIGDSISFSIGGITRNAVVDNIRSVSWNSMNPNFYIIFNQPFVENASANYLTSFKLSEDKRVEFAQFAKAHPAISFIELDSLISQIQSMIEQISHGIEFILVLVLIAGLLVLVVISRLSNRERIRHNAIIKSFGAKNRFVLNLALSEFLLIGVITALLAVPASLVTLSTIQRTLFQSSYQINFFYVVIAVLSVIGLCVISGYLSIRSTLKVAPITILR